MRGIVVYAPGPCPSLPQICEIIRYQGRVLVKTEKGERLTQFLTNQKGEFSIEVNPGTYILEPEFWPQGLKAGFNPSQKVFVRQHVFSEVLVRFGGE